VTVNSILSSARVQICVKPEADPAMESIRHQNRNQR
jgi:hypothetical protein